MAEQPLLLALDLAGTFAFALNGAITGLKEARLDIVGMLTLGMVTALVPAFYLLARHGSAARKMGIPLGPFLALGAVIALFAGHTLLHLYLHR